MTRSYWKDKYGSLVTFAFPEKDMIIINEFQLTKDLFNQDIVSARGDSDYLSNVRGDKGKKTGILFTDGHVWTEQRRFSLKALRDLGFGKNQLDSRMHEEVQIMIREFFLLDGESNQDLRLGNIMSLNNYAMYNYYLKFRPYCIQHLYN